MQLTGTQWKRHDSGRSPSNSWKIFLPRYNENIDKVGAKIDRGLAGNKGYVLDTIKELIRDSMSAGPYRQQDSVEVFRLAGHGRGESVAASARSPSMETGSPP